MKHRNYSANPKTSKSLIACPLSRWRGSGRGELNKQLASDMLAYDILILGTPTYGEGLLPGLSTGNATESWEEFLPALAGQDFSGKKVAIYGLANQKSYPSEFVDALFHLYKQFIDCGATLIGEWASEGYNFKASKAVVDGHFVGLALDQENQKDLTPDRLDSWLKMLAKSWD